MEKKKYSSRSGYRGNIIKAIYDKPTANVMLNNKKPKSSC